MESGLTPREIQERVRAGETLDEVAEVAGMPRDRVERFALAVYDERRHMAQQALSHSVRRTGETASHRTLRTVANEAFLSAGVDLDTVEWDATRGEDRHFWTVTATWQAGDDEQHGAEFGYDVRGAFSTAANETARDLIGDQAPAAGDDEDADPDDDNEPTINYADQFAIVNAVQDEPADATAPVDADRGQHADQGAQDEAPISGPFDLHDIVPTPESELDALYAMLRGHQEDSVNIYAGLSESEIPQPAPKQRRNRRRRQQGEQPSDEQPASTEAVDEPATETIDGIEQPSLLDTPEPPPPSPKKRPRKRASVPSWDQIMFGGPDKE